MTRRRRVLAAAVTAAVAGVALAACSSQNALHQAQQACSGVSSAATLYQESLRATGARQANLQTEALTDLRNALPFAAQAASQDAAWQGLMTDLAETSRVPVSDLMSGLEQLCASASQGSAPTVGGGADTTSTG